MPVLSPETVLVNDGDIKLYKRARSRVWQATFNIDGHWVRVSAKHKDLEEAKVEAKKLMMEYLPMNSRIRAKRKKKDSVSHCKGFLKVLITSIRE
jgi:hypothetical protein